MKRRGQEEIVGFVLIVVIVSIAFLVFLTIFLRQDTSNLEVESQEVYSFLESSLEYTSDCATSFAPAYHDVGELLSECLSNSRCIDGRDSCEVLNETLSEILENSFVVKEGSFLRGFEFNSYYERGNSSEEIFTYSKGDCSGSLRGAEALSAGNPGRIISSMSICT